MFRYRHKVTRPWAGEAVDHTPEEPSRALAAHDVTTPTNAESEQSADDIEALIALFDDADMADSETELDGDDVASGGRSNDALIGGIDPLNDYFFGTMFRQMTFSAYDDDLPVKRYIAKATSSVINAGHIYTAARRILLAATLVAIGLAATNAFSISALEASIGGASSESHFVVMTLIILAGAFVLDRMLGYVLGSELKSKRSELTKFILGKCFDLKDKASDEISAISSAHADHVEKTSDVSYDWPRHARQHYLDGRKFAKRLKLMEMFTLLEMRRIATAFRQIDVISTIFNVVIGIGFAAGFLALADYSVIGTPAVVTVTAIVVLYFTFAGSKNNEAFSRGVINEIFNSEHSYDNFELGKKICQIIERDQVEIRRLKNRLRAN